MESCPKCHQRFSEGHQPFEALEECPYCGVILKKYLASLPPSIPVASPYAETAATNPVPSEDLLVDGERWELPYGLSFVRASMKRRISAGLYDSFTFGWMAVLLLTFITVLRAFVFYDPDRPRQGLLSPATFADIGGFFLFLLLILVFVLPLLTRGQSPGQKANGIHLAARAGRAITIMTWIKRGLGDLLICCSGLLLLLLPLFRKDKRDLKEVLSDTLLVEEKDPPTQSDPAWKPFFATLLLCLLLFLPTTLFIEWASHSGQEEAGGSASTSPAQGPGSRISMADRLLLTQINNWQIRYREIHGGYCGTLSQLLEWADSMKMNPSWIEMAREMEAGGGLSLSLSGNNYELRMRMSKGREAVCHAEGCSFLIVNYRR